MPRTEKASVEVNGETLTFRFTDGNVLQASLAAVEPWVRRLALHGLEQKLRDSYAGAEPDEAYAFARATWERLLAGEWSKRREAAEPREDSIELLATAVRNVLQKHGKPVPADLVERLRALDRSARAKLRASQEVAVELAKLRAKPGKDAIESILGV